MSKVSRLRVYVCVFKDNISAYVCVCPRIIFQLTCTVCVF